MWGTVVNAAAIIAGALTGSVFNRTLPQRFQRVIFQGMGLFVMALGVSMAIKMERALISVFALLLGSIAGELLKLDVQIAKLGDWLKRNLKLKTEKFNEGFVSASLIYCVGTMAVLGAIEEGVGKYPAILLTKSVMDGFSSVALSASMGIGVAFSSLPVAIYQGVITLVAFLLTDTLNMAIINELSAVGGILLVGLSFNILEIKEIKVVNMLPSLVFVVVFMML